MIQEYSKEASKTDVVITEFGISISSYVPLILYEVTYKFLITTNPKFVHICIPIPPPFQLLTLFLSFNDKKYELLSKDKLKSVDNIVPGIDITLQNIPPVKNCTIKFQIASLMCCSNHDEWIIEFPYCLFPSKFSSVKPSKQSSNNSVSYYIIIDGIICTYSGIKNIRANVSERIKFENINPTSVRLEYKGSSINWKTDLDLLISLSIESASSYALCVQSDNLINIAFCLSSSGGVQNTRQEYIILIDGNAFHQYQQTVLKFTDNFLGKLINKGKFRLYMMSKIMSSFKLVGYPINPQNILEALDFIKSIKTDINPLSLNDLSSLAEFIKDQKQARTILLGGEDIYNIAGIDPNKDISFVILTTRLLANQIDSRDLHPIVKLSNDSDIPQAINVILNHTMIKISSDVPELEISKEKYSFNQRYGKTIAFGQMHSKVNPIKIKINGVSTQIPLLTLQNQEYAIFMKIAKNFQLLKFNQTSVGLQEFRGKEIIEVKGQVLHTV